MRGVWTRYEETSSVSWENSFINSIMIQYQIATVTEAGVNISEQKGLETSWDFAEGIRGYGAQTQWFFAPSILYALFDLTIVEWGLLFCLLCRLRLRSAWSWFLRVRVLNTDFVEVGLSRPIFADSCRSKRTTIDIVWSCVSTTIICAYPNIPLKAFCSSCFRPELMLSWAARQ